MNTNVILRSGWDSKWRDDLTLRVHTSTLARGTGR